MALTPSNGTLEGDQCTEQGFGIALLQHFKFFNPENPAPENCTEASYPDVFNAVGRIYLDTINILTALGDSENNPDLNSSRIQRSVRDILEPPTISPQGMPRSHALFCVTCVLCIVAFAVLGGHLYRSIAKRRRARVASTAEA